MKILQIPYYPATPAVTGGQRRVEKLRALLLRCGHKVSQAAICPRRPDVRKDDLPLTRELDKWIFKLPYDFEMRITRAIEIDTLFRAKVRGALRAHKPDLVWLEHPFLWPVVRGIFKSIPIVYSSHNAEWMMKRDLLKKLPICDPRCVELVRQNEDDLSRNAAFIVCCSEGDERYFNGLNKNCILVRNGAEIPSVNAKTTAEAEIAAEAPDVFSKPTFAFISSYHEPNWFGFVDLVLGPLLNQPPCSPVTVIIIGGVGELYKRWKTKHTLPPSIQIIALSSASEEAKNLVLLNSKAILLPIMQGGGTNLKTAEAILANSPIIGTTTAFRGFEKFQCMPTVSLADTPAQFYDAILQAVVQHAAQRKSSSDRSGLRCEAGLLGDSEEVSWHRILEEAAPKIESALRASTRELTAC